MTSKNAASSKRATLPRTADYSKAFLKDWERLSRSGRFDLKRLKEAMLLLVANDGPLGHEWLDHPLKGNWDGLLRDPSTCVTELARDYGVSRTTIYKHCGVVQPRHD